MAFSFLRFLDHTQRRTTVGRTPLDEWSVRRRDLYLTTHNTHNRQTSMPPVGFEPAFSASERPQTDALDRAATGFSQRRVYLSLTHSVKQSPSWEAGSFSASQKIASILWKLKVYYYIYSRPPSVPILTQINPIHPPPHFHKINLNINLPSMSGSSKWSFSFGFLYQIPVYASPILLRCYMPRPSHSSRFDHPNCIWWALEIIELLIM